MEFMDEFYRFMLSYYHDHSVENVWIEHQGRIFSDGMDYEDLHRTPQYIDKLYKTAILLSQFNKPIFYKINGSVRGLASNLLTLFSVGLGTASSSLAFNDVSKGFIPIAGGSHRLAQFPSEIGMYMALTCESMNLEEMMSLNVAHGYVDNETPNHEIRRCLSNANLYMSR